MGKLLFAIVIIFSLMPAYGADPDELLENPQLEERARQISKHLRCVVCQSQSIDDSDAPLAKDMRILVRERLLAGDRDEEIYKFMVDRYGDYVLLKPQFQKSTVFLWLAPILLLGGGALGCFFYFRRMKRLYPEADMEPVIDSQASKDRSKP